MARPLSRAILIAALLGSSLLSLAGRAAGGRTITSPREQFGFAIGDDYHLVNYTQLKAYWERLARESDRVRLVQIGETEEGRPMVMAIVTSPANHRRLDRYRQIARRLALAEGLTDAQAAELAREGRAVVWIDGGLHASETLGFMQLIETVYQLASGQDAETRRILDEVIVLAVPANPDGIELVANWYMRHPDPRRRSLAGLPRLYQKYIGHDNNRDFYMGTQRETQAMNRVMYREWFPQIVYNHHQTGPAGTVMFAPPFRDPFNYRIDPLVISGMEMVAAAMMNRFVAEGKPGVTTRTGASYSAWWNGGLRTTAYFHNMIGILTETIGSPTPTRIPLVLERQLPRGHLIYPIEPQEWPFRRSIEYSVTANRAVLDYAARYRTELLLNLYRAGRNSIERGSRDSWSVYPTRLAAAEERFRQGRGADSIAAVLRAPEARDPRGFILPADQPDFPTAIKFANCLMQTGVRVERATRAFVVGGKRYPAGSLVVRCAQAFRPHILDMFEPQDHPDDVPYPGAAPTPPYDNAGWTLAFQMGIEFDRILDGFDGPFEELPYPASPPPGRVTGSEGAVGFLLSARQNDAFRAVNRLLARGLAVSRLTEDHGDGRAGDFYVPATATAREAIAALARDLGVDATGVTSDPGGRAVPIAPARIALWDRYGGSIPSGWTRWILEQFEFPHEVVFPPRLDAGNLRAQFDVLILPDGAFRAGATPAPPPGDEADLPAEYRGRRGRISVERTLPHLRRFLEEGGTLLAIGGSTALARALGLPVANHLVERTATGQERPLPRSAFYVPGSVVQARVATAHPLAWGMRDPADFLFDQSPVFRVQPSPTLHVIAWFDRERPLRSGWAWGQRALQNGAAVVEARVGAGRLVLYGPEVLFRGQAHGTFKLIFNALYRTAAAP